MSKKSLIYSNDNSFASTLEDFLIIEGFDVDISYSTGNIKKSMQMKRYDVIFIDISKSDSKYISLIYELRKICRDEFPPIILISTQHSSYQNEKNDWQAFLIMDWIEKPVTLKQLHKSLHLALERTCSNNIEVLHIEDDQEIIQLVTVMLEGFAKVTPATTVHEATNLSSSKKYDIVILDLYLPDGKGEDVLQMLKGKLSTSQPVIILSGKRFDHEETIPNVMTFIASTNSHADLYETICPLLKSIRA